MRKSKSVLVTVVMGTMLATIVVCTKLLFPVVFSVLIGSLAGVGFVYGVCWFYKWISKPFNPEKDGIMEDIPKMIQVGPAVIGEIVYTYDQVKEEVMEYE